jgi:hypothetical protein
MKYNALYGFYIALALIVINTIFVDIIGVGNDFVRQFSGLSPFVILAIGLFIAMRKIKAVVYANQWNYGHAIYVGIVLTAFTALVLSVYNFLYFQYINPDFVNEIIAVTKPLMIKEKLSLAEMNKEIAIIRESYLPVKMFKGTITMILIAGIVFSSIYSSILRTQDAFTQITKPRE